MAWTNERFSYSGEYYSYENVCVVPKPVQSPHPPIRIAATTNETFPANGKMGYPLLIGLRTVALPGVTEQVASYKKAYKEAGHEAPMDVSLRIPVVRGRGPRSRDHRAGGELHAAVSQASAAAGGG